MLEKLRIEDSAMGNRSDETAANALLVVSYGGPENVGDVEPFLDRVLAGKNVPEPRRRAAARKYYEMGGESPINSEVRTFVRRLRERFESNERANAEPVRVYWGNLYSPPFLVDSVRRMQADAVDSFVLFPTSTIGSPQSCRRYIDAVQNAIESVGAATTFVKTPLIGLHPKFLRASADSLLLALAQDSLSRCFQESDDAPLVLFSAHSLPTQDAEKSKYREQLERCCREIVQAIDSRKTPGEPPTRWELVFQSRSGSPKDVWLEPTIEDFVRKYKAERPNWSRLIVSPIGFFLENMETVYDLDVSLAGVCRELGITLRRAATSGTDPNAVDAVVSLVENIASRSVSCPCERGRCDCSCSQFFI